MRVDLREASLREHFVSCGCVEGVRLVRDKSSGLGKGFGYVLFQVRHPRHKPSQTITNHPEGEWKMASSDVMPFNVMADKPLLKPLHAYNAIYNMEYRI